MKAIQTFNVSKSYRGKKVLDNVSISIDKGDIYGLVGRNGAGKTTLMSIIAGLTNADGGSVAINGEDGAKALSRERGRMGTIINTPSFFPNLSAYDNVKMFSKQLGCFSDEKVRAVLRVVGLSADDKKTAGKFSLGMKQRLAIGIALIGEPSLLMLDEPVNGLDPEGIYEMRELLLYLNREKGVTILISSHLLGELSKFATCYGVMENGKLIKEFRGSELTELCRPYIKLTVGDMKPALRVMTENYPSSAYSILPYNTIAVYDLSRDVQAIAKLMLDASVPIVGISREEGDMESVFISMMGGESNVQYNVR